MVLLAPASMTGWRATGPTDTQAQSYGQDVAAGWPIRTWPTRVRLQPEPHPAASESEPDALRRCGPDVRVGAGPISGSQTPSGQSGTNRAPAAW